MQLSELKKLFTITFYQPQTVEWKCNLCAPRYICILTHLYSLWQSPAFLMSLNKTNPTLSLVNLPFFTVHLRNHFVLWFLYHICFWISCLFSHFSIVHNHCVRCTCYFAHAIQKLTSRLTTAFSVIAHNHFSVQPSHQAVCEISHTYINMLFFPLWPCLSWLMGLHGMLSHSSV